MNDGFKIYENLKYCLVNFSEVVDAGLCYTKDTFKAFGNAVVVYFLVCACFYFFNEKYSFINVDKFYKNFRRVLIVTAHPDDECMFFGPLIINLLRTSDYKVFLLCLSNGNYGKLGAKRKEELWNSCKTLGIESSNIFLCKSPFMEDDPNLVWRKDEVATHILEHVEMLDIDAIVTFDEEGVSGHYNHISIFNAVCFLIMKNLLPSQCTVFVLESINVFRKYTNYLDALLTFSTSNHVCQIRNAEHKTVIRAMKQHSSQYIWFRKLYMHFSRYAYINSFRKIDKYNMFLEMDDLQAG